ncbi:hypothetical protein Btru_070933 [Bulinus truncatus]|nr:hypothetical protein Btru_070933 [Bulinus truncatus]
MVLKLPDAASANINVELKRSLLGHGFHRDLVTTIVISPNVRKSHSMPQCCILMVESLPPGVYADPYQLNSLKPFGGPQVVFDRPVNIEAAEFMSSSHELYIYLNVSEHSMETSSGNTVINVSYPIHARYHRPSKDIDVTHVTVTLLHPTFYSNCSQSDQVSHITAPCDVSNTTFCHWMPLTYLSSSAPLTLQVPVGQESHKPLVIVVTLLVSITVSALLVKAMWTFRIRKHDKHL